ncbi:MAG: response regulator [Helicobacteraceae bacterium]|nr:response regulator [Helicobacteraceae bacterium]
MQNSKEIQEKTKTLREIGYEIDVLIVEDDEILLKQMYNLLSKFFRRVDLAEHGLEALNRLSERSYDLIITDLTMPLIDGFALIENIRQNDIEQNILVLSAHSESEKLLRLIDIGIDGFLLKPVNMDIILLKLFKISKEIYNKKAREEYMRLLEVSNTQLQQRDSELNMVLHEVTTLKKQQVQIQDDEKMKEGISATDFVNLYSHEIAHVNEELEILEDKFNAFLLQQEKSIDYKNLQTIIELLKEYVLHLDNFLEFKYLVEDLENLIENLETLHININIEIWMPSFVLLFENFEQLRRGVFESQSVQNIHAYDRNFAKIFQYIQRDRDNALELLGGLLA